MRSKSCMWSICLRECASVSGRGQEWGGGESGGGAGQKCGGARGSGGEGGGVRERQEGKRQVELVRGKTGADAGV